MIDTLKPRWFHPTPDRLVLVLLAVEGLLWLSDRLGWPEWHKGYAVLAAVASVGVFLLLMLLWFIAALIFRWRFQFSIRSLLVLVVAVAVPCSWLAVEMKKAKAQREAVEATGAGVVYDFQFDKAGINSLWLPGPAWLPNLLGYDFFGNVVVAYFYFEDSDPDAKLEHLKNLPQLTRVEVDHLTDAGLKRLRGLKQLEHLFLIGEFTDAGLQHLEGLTQLQDLHLGSPNVTDECVRKLQKALPNCKINCPIVRSVDEQPDPSTGWETCPTPAYSPCGAADRRGGWPPRRPQKAP
jgi:hypothetical protein